MHNHGWYKVAGFLYVILRLVFGTVGMVTRGRVLTEYVY